MYRVEHQFFLTFRHLREMRKYIQVACLERRDLHYTYFQTQFVKPNYLYSISVDLINQEFCSNRKNEQRNNSYKEIMGTEKNNNLE